MENENFTTAWKHRTSGAGKNYAKLIDDSRMLHVIPKAACFLVTYQKELFSWWLLYVVCGFMNNKGYIFEFLNTWYFSIHGFTFFLCKGAKAHQSILSKNTSWVWTPCGLLWKLVQVFEFYSKQIYFSPTCSATGLILYSSDTNMKGAAFLLLVYLPQSWLYGWLGHLCWRGLGG